MGLLEEGIKQAREALDIWESPGNAVEQAFCFITLAGSLFSDNQLDAAEQTVLCAINLTDGRSISGLYLSSCSWSNWHDCLFRINHSLTWLYLDECRFDEAQAHVERAKSHAADSLHHLGSAAELQVLVWCGQPRLKEGSAEALRATEIYEELGAVGYDT